jgi:glycosyltransferase involved in cell wall biosynthesis
MSPTPSIEAPTRAVSIIFVPYITAYGGEERLILSLAECLHLRQCPHRVVCFGDALGLAARASFPLQIECLTPARNVFGEIFALRRYLNARKREIAGRILAMTMRSAIYCGTIQSSEFVLIVNDPPSLLPTDISRLSASARRAWPPLNAYNKGSLFQQTRGEVVHRLNRRGIWNARCVCATTHRTARELSALYSISSEIVHQGARKPARQLQRNYRPSNPFRFLSLSRLESNKRIDWILHALALLEKRNPPLSATVPWELDIVGQGLNGPASKLWPPIWD